MLNVMSRLFFLAFSFASLLSCSKSEDKQTECPISFSNMVGNWKWEKVEVFQNGSFKDYTSTIEACQKDDYFSFLSNKTYVRVDAGIKCSPPIVESGIWDYQNNSFIVDNQMVEIVRFNCSTATFISFRGGEKYRFTYVKL